MNLQVVLIIVCIAGVLADNTIWVQLMSMQIQYAAEETILADKNIPELATDLGLNIFVALANKTGLNDTLSEAGPFTVFGPTDEAFKNLPKELIHFLLKNVSVLTEIMKYHVTNDSFDLLNVTTDQLIPSLEGRDIRINIYKNGTVITASGRPITLADQVASNGIIHEVGAVLFPPPGSIAFIVSKCPVFKMLFSAIRAAGLDSVLDGAGPFTIFAPTDKAIAKLPRKCRDDLLNNITLLTSVLEYHVVPATEYSAGLSCGDELVTLQGESVKVTKFKGFLRVNYVRVVFADGPAANGVIHVIDRVLWPKEIGKFCHHDDERKPKNDDDSGEPQDDDAGFETFFTMK